MRDLLIIGGEARMTGLCADRIADDLEGLLSGLKNTEQYSRIILMPTQRFLQAPGDHTRLLELAVFDEALLEAARSDPMKLKTKVLRESYAQATALFCETLLSFTGGRKIVLIPDAGNLCARSLLKFVNWVEEINLSSLPVHCSPQPLLKEVCDWSLVFTRFEDPFLPERLLPGGESKFHFTDKLDVPMEDILCRAVYALKTPCNVSFPAVDTLNHPRALLIRSPNGFLLTMPRPSNMKDLSRTLRSLPDDERVDRPQAAPDEPRPPQEVEPVKRDWMTRNEAAQAIRKSTDTVDNYCRDGKLTKHKVGRDVRITKESVQRFLEEK
jgi:excisionase family DNA binding protein